MKDSAGPGRLRDHLRALVSRTTEGVDRLADCLADLDTAFVRPVFRELILRFFGTSKKGIYTGYPL